jgi:hypothetical protein
MSWEEPEGGLLFDDSLMLGTSDIGMSSLCEDVCVTSAKTPFDKVVAAFVGNTTRPAANSQQQGRCCYCPNEVAYDMTWLVRMDVRHTARGLRQVRRYQTWQGRRYGMSG